MRLLILGILYFSLFSFISSAQKQKPYGEFSSPETKSTEKKLLKSARTEFDYGNYDLASQKYLELLKIDSTNPMYNFEHAQTLYNNYRQTQSIRFYENAIRHSKDSLGEAYYFLASAYHLAGKFTDAVKNYKTYLKILNYYGTDLMMDEEEELKKGIEHKIEMCANGINIYKLPPASKFKMNGKERPFIIEAAGKDVNSNYDDYGAVFSSNDSVMYFTSRREGTTGGKVDWDDKFFEDIYMAGYGVNGWGNSFGIGVPINTKKHEAVISLSPDSKTIYFYRGVKQGTFFYSNLFGGAWTEPKVLYEKSDLNTKSWETSFFGFALSGNELYVVSDREGGLGGRDIYIAKKQADGSWGSLSNLGAPINTIYDEDAPFITSDGKTMYFSSKGHNSMGGFDIFTSSRDGDKWTAPKNLGLPFNTPGEDIYFVQANKSDRAYYSSSAYAKDGTNDMDIYMIDLCDEQDDVLLAGVAKGFTNGVVAVYDQEGKKKVAEAKIENGKYAVRLKHGQDYRFSFTVQTGSDPISTDLSIPKLCKVYDMYQELDVIQSPQNLIVKSAFFNINSQRRNTSASEYISNMDKSKISLYTEVSLPLTVILATADSVKTNTVSTTTTSVSTPTVTTSTPTVTVTTPTVSASTPTVAVSTPTVTTSTPTVAVSTPTVIASTPTVAVSTPTVSASTGETSSTVTTISVSNILFDYDRSSIKGEFSSELDKVATFLKSSKNAKINVAGYTDSKGSDAYNLGLSKRRANAVAAYLASKGISRNRISTTGYGEAKPIAPNENPDGSDNPEGRAKNRRTEITVIQ